MRPGRRFPCSLVPLWKVHQVRWQFTRGGKKLAGRPLAARGMGGPHLCGSAGWMVLAARAPGLAPPLRPDALSAMGPTNSGACEDLLTPCNLVTVRTVDATVCTDTGCYLGVTCRIPAVFATERLSGYPDRSLALHHESRGLLALPRAVTRCQHADTIRIGDLIRRSADTTYPSISPTNHHQPH